MLRKSLTILSLVGLLLSVGLWGVTYSQAVYCADDSGWYITACLGALWIGKAPALAVEGCFPVSHTLAERRSLKDDIEWWPTFHRGGIFILPLWIPAFLFGGASAYVLGLPLYRRRCCRRLGLCVECGYDLRGSSEKCPECGEGI